MTGTALGCTACQLMPQLLLLLLATHIELALAGTHKRAGPSGTLLKLMMMIKTPCATSQPPAGHQPDTMCHQADSAA